VEASSTGLLGDFTDVLETRRLGQTPSAKHLRVSWSIFGGDRGQHVFFRIESFMTEYTDFSAILSTEGCVVGPCWEKLKYRGRKGIKPHLPTTFLSF